MAERITTCGELIGAALFSYGAYLAWHPLGFMVAGSLSVGLSWLVAR